MINSRISVRFRLVLIGALALLASQAYSQIPNDPYYIPPEKVISYTKDIRPILHQKCVACPGYVAAYVKQGMPFAVAGLTLREYAAMRKEEADQRVTTH